MTRKKFVKQLMALGISRNRANFRAQLCRDHRIAYAEDYKAYLPYIIPATKNPKEILRLNKITGLDMSAGPDFGCEIIGHYAQTPDGREILVIDEMNLLPPLIKNEGVLLQVTVGGGGHE